MATSSALEDIVLDEMLPQPLRRLALRFLLTERAEDTLSRISVSIRDLSLQQESQLFLAMVKTNSSLCSLYEAC